MHKQKIFYWVLIAFMSSLSYKVMGANHHSIHSGFYNNDIEGGGLEIISSSNGAIYGEFEFYEHWDQKANFFENVMTFYFYGDKRINDTIFINAGLPGIEVADGILVLHGNDSITLYTDFTSGYAVTDFKHGYHCKLNSRSNSISLGIIKEKKCFLYKAPNDTTVMKSYLVEKDFVSIIQKKADWVLITYTSPFNAHPITKWIKANTLYDEDPKKW